MEMPSLTVLWSLSWSMVLAGVILFPVWWMLGRVWGAKAPFLSRGVQAMQRIARMQATARDIALLFSVDLAVAAVVTVVVAGQDALAVASAAAPAAALAWLIAYAVPIPGLVALTTLLIVLGGIITPVAVWSAPASGNSPAATQASPVPVVNTGAGKQAANPAAPNPQAPTQPARPNVAANASLHPGGRAMVMARSSLNLRQSPSGPLIGALAPGTVAQVLEGPVAGAGYTWWRIQVGDQSGWCAQGSGTEQWLRAVE
jgi:hypothetical protein